MRLLATFVGHEVRTQWRSGRFRALAGTYTAIAVVPAALLAFAAARARASAGPAAISSYIDVTQPLLTFLFSAVIAVDALSRERDEGSFGVLSLAPVSSAGYVLRRWVALLAVLLPVTALPRIAGVALAWWTARGSSPAFVVGWATSAVPQVLLGSALGIALGTISGGTVLAALLGGAVFTVGLELFNDVLFRFGRHVDGLGDALGLNPASMNRIGALVWAVRGYFQVDLPTDAGVDVRAAFAPLAGALAVPAAIALLLLAIAPAFLRRTRADLRPWNIRESHPLRSVLGMLNRLREEFWPDAAPSTTEWAALAAGVTGAALLLGMTFRLADSREREAAAELLALTSPPPAPMSPALVPVAAKLRGDVETDGEVRTAGEIAFRNAGSRPESHLAFAIDPHVVVTLRSGGGTLRVHRIWDRLTADIEPPIAPGASRSLAFDVRGTPGVAEFESSSFFMRAYRRHRQAKLMLDKIDFSRVSFHPAAGAVATLLAGRQLMPVPRYTPWVVRPGKNTDLADVTDEQITPATSLSADIRFAAGHLVADSCGTVAAGTLRTVCAGALERFTVFAARLKTMPLARGARLAYIPQHEENARAHALSFNEALTTAWNVWPGLERSTPALLIEKPRQEFENEWFAPYSQFGARRMSSAGALHFVPESLIARSGTIDTGAIAASLIMNAVTTRRRMASGQERFFRDFVFTVAMNRTGGRPGDAVVPGTGPLPDTEPLVDRGGWGTGRMTKVVRDLEHRVGPDRLVEGIDDFVSSSPDGGTARGLLQAIGRRAGIPLDRFYDDYVAGTALPKLELAGVAFRREGAAWVVTGRLANRGTGEAVCPVVLRTAWEPDRRTLAVGPHGEVPFSFVTHREPRSVQLDPERVCYRWAAVGLVDNVENRSAP